MFYLITIFVIIFGLIVGSFLNVLLFRMHNKPSRYSRSKCLSCGHTLASIDLVPVFSFLFSHGRCRYCHSKISRQYIIVELTVAILFALVFLRGGLDIEHILDPFFILWTIIFWVIVFLLSLISFYDIKHKIVPLVASIPFVLISFLSIFINHSGEVYFKSVLTVFHSGEMFAGICLAAPFFFLWLFSRGRWIGFGDIVLMLGIGWLLGLAGGVTAILFSFWIATLFLLLICLPALYIFNKSLCNIRKGFIMKAEIPLVPFLAIGTMVVLLGSVSIFKLLGL